MIRTVAFTMSKLPTGETKTINAFIEKLFVLTMASKLNFSKVDQDYHGHRGEQSNPVNPYTYVQPHEEMDQ